MTLESLKNSPLTSEEKRELLIRLHQLEILKIENKLLWEQIQATNELLKSIKEVNAEAIQAKEQTIQSLQAEVDVWREQAEFFKDAFEQAKRRPLTFGCVMKKIFTLGMAACRR